MLCLCGASSDLSYCFQSCLRMTNWTRDLCVNIFMDPYPRFDLFRPTPWPYPHPDLFHPYTLAHKEFIIQSHSLHYRDMSMPPQKNEKGPSAPTDESVDSLSAGELSSSEAVALQALEKRVLRKTDMIVLPMV